MVAIRASDLNAFLKSVTGGDFTAKDFRTWHATVLAAVSLAHAGRPATTRERKRAVNVRCGGRRRGAREHTDDRKASYIDPRVFDRYSSGNTISRSARRQREVERSVIALLED